MRKITQSELSERYDLKLPLLSKIMKIESVKKVGYKKGKYKALVAYDEQEATLAIIRYLNRQLKGQRDRFNETKAVYNRVMSRARESGILRETV